MKKYFIFIFCIGILTVQCHKKQPESNTIIARIADRPILYNEFIRRAEYTIRPVYCRGNNIIHKKIVLNSLIAEKLLALEAENHHALEDNENFKAYIQGRKEQAMRKVLFDQKAYQKVRLKTEEINDLFNVSGRKYHVQYFNIPDSTVAEQIEAELENHPEAFKSIFEKYYDSDLPVREVAWSDYEDERIEEVLFSKPVENGSVFGPLEVERNQFLFMRVNGWTDTKVLAESDIRERLDQVKERLTLREASRIWDRFVARVMKGKQLLFKEDTFYRLTEIYADLYHFKEEDRNEMFNNQFWNRPGQDTDSELIEQAMKREEALWTAPFFTIDGRQYSVHDFRRMLASHPLVFRKRRFSRSEFPEQFKLAVVDLIRDQYLNKTAEKNGLDKNPWVKQTVLMWSDAVLGQYQRNTYLDSIGKKEAFIGNFMQVVREDLNPYIRSLQQKYSDRIEIDAELLKQIQLTRVDMMAIQKWEPYPIVVPQFPVVTDEHRMDYGRDMASP
jgi:hypothetical protein